MIPKEPLRDFTKGEILLRQLRLIASAIRECPLIAGDGSRPWADPFGASEGDKPKPHSKISPLVKSLSGSFGIITPPPSPGQFSRHSCAGAG